MNVQTVPNLRPARRTLVSALVAVPFGVALMASPASAHTATATALAGCRSGQPVQTATFVNDWQDAATVVVGSNVLTLPAMGSVSTQVPAGNVQWTATWTDSFVEEGTLTVRGRTDCVPPVSNAPTTTGLPTPVAPPTTVTPTVAPPVVLPVTVATVPVVEIGTATILERPVEQPTELARTGRNTVWTVLAGVAFLVFGAAFAIVEKVIK